MRRSDVVRVAPPSIAGLTLTEQSVTQGDPAVFGSLPAFEIGVLSWSSPDGSARPVRLTFPPLQPVTGRGGGAAALPRAGTLTPGFAAAVIEYTPGGSAPTAVIVDWPYNGRSATLVASRVNIRLRTQVPGTVTAAGRCVFSAVLSDAGQATPLDFGPMTYTEIAESTVPAGSAVNLYVPQGAVAVRMSPQAAGVQMTTVALDEASDLTLIDRYAAAAAGTERPDVPFPIPAGCQVIQVQTSGVVTFAIRPTWMILL